MLDCGEKLFDQYASEAREAGSNELHGHEMWRLYDAFGFPVDLTRLMVEELSMTVNKKERKDKADTLKLDVHDLAALEKNSAIPKTDDISILCKAGLCHDHDKLWESSPPNSSNSCPW